MCSAQWKYQRKSSSSRSRTRRQCPRPIGGPENEEAVIPSSGRAGEENRERKQPQCSLDSIPFHFGGAVGVP